MGVLKGRHITEYEWLRDSTWTLFMLTIALTLPHCTNILFRGERILPKPASRSTPRDQLRALVILSREHQSVSSSAIHEQMNRYPNEGVLRYIYVTTSDNRQPQIANTS